MSRGPGWLQRAIVNFFESDARCCRAIDVAAAVFSVPANAAGVQMVSEAQYAAVRRVLSGMRRQGMVATADWRWPDHQERVWVSPGFTFPDAFVPPKSDRQLAREIGVSASTMHRARRTSRLNG